MAGVSTKDIKNRIRSMESTKQITKAMEMVAASKLRHAQARVLNSRPYFEILYSTISDIVDSNRDFSSPYLMKRPVKKAAYIVIAGDRGLAGGYNSNILKLVQAETEGKNVTILPIGKKAVDYFKAHHYELLTDTYVEAADVSIGDCFTMANQLCKAFRWGKVDELRLAYTKFESVLSQQPCTMRLLPFDEPNAEVKEKKSEAEIMYEPNALSVFFTITPEYIGGVLYGALCESRASEQAARRTAMDSATQNADEMIADLSLKYNQARQAAITQEITEIVAGS
jgi:F-type H+-transporting ATPase subunit gamma